MRRVGLTLGLEEGFLLGVIVGLLGRRDSFTLGDVGANVRNAVHPLVGTFVGAIVGAGV